jgi:hypothetical protein
MIEIIDLSTVIVAGQAPQDLVSAIANNLQGDLAGILEALKTYDVSRSSTASTETIKQLKQQSQLIEQQYRQQITDRDATIAQLQTQLSPDIASLIGPLRSAGLDAWGDAAVTAGENLMPLVLELLSIASQPAKWNQCQQIKDLFGAICQQSGVLPTQEQAIAMQAILDNGSPTTGPVAKDWLRFV